MLRFILVCIFLKIVVRKERLGLFLGIDRLEVSLFICDFYKNKILLKDIFIMFLNINFK